MGCGKSAIGRRAAARLGLPFIDTDSEIELRQGCRISEIFAECGEEAFRQMETAVLYGLLLSDMDAIISLGGGTPVRRSNIPIIRRLGRVIYLKAPAEVLIDRLKRGAEERPMLYGYELEDRVRGLLRERESIYESVADEILDVSDSSMEDICSRIAERAAE